MNDRLQVTNCGPRRVNNDDKIFAKFVWIDNTKYIQLLACRNNPLACLAKVKLLTRVFLLLFVVINICTK